MSHPGERDQVSPVIGPTERGESYEDALRSEKAGYEARGLDDRAAEVQAELERDAGPTGAPAGDAPETADESAPVETATPAKPAKRARK